MVSELKRVVIYTWAIPQGGLFKVIEKEYEYLSKMIDAPLFVTSEPVPEPYKEEFRKIHGVSLSESIESIYDRDLSFFFPGLDISIKGGIVENIRLMYGFLLREKPHTILVHQLLSAFIVLPYSIIHRTRVVLVLHDNPFMFIENNSKNRIGLKSLILMYLAYMVEKLTLKRSMYVICTTSQIKESVMSHLDTDKNLVVASYGLDTFTRVKMQKRDVILTVTKWSRFRRPEMYLKVLKQLPENISLTIAGRWDSEKDLSAFLVSVDSMGLSDRVETIRNLTEDELSKLYDRTKVFLRLGFNETGTGQAILEAIGHGCPVVISKGLGASEFVRDGVNGFIVNENHPADVASRIKEIYSSDDLFYSMSDAAYTLAESSGWENYLAKILETIKS